MSYSRWSDSKWYTYWQCQDDSTENKDTAIFCICGIVNFTAKELRNDVVSCINKVKSLVLDESITCTVGDDFGELLMYMNEFLLDVSNTTFNK